MKIAKPAFATLTGCNRSDSIAELRDIAQQFREQVEFGILVNAESFGTGRFPTLDVINDLRRSGLRLSAHLCGALADQVFAGGDIDFNLAGFSRVQVNLLNRHANKDEVEHAIHFGMTRGIRVILQYSDTYPDDTRCDWLLDNSFGTGRAVRTVPDMSRTSAFCGISGGLSQATVLDTIMGLPNVDRPYWIDAESALFMQNGFSTQACRSFLARVLG